MLKQERARKVTEKLERKRKKQTKEEAPVAQADATTDVYGDVMEDGEARGGSARLLRGARDH